MESVTGVPPVEVEQVVGLKFETVGNLSISVGLFTCLPFVEFSFRRSEV